MISVIIPTLNYNLHTLENLVWKLSKSPQVREIIIVNNTGHKLSLVHNNKVNQIINSENAFVNASWNQGIVHVHPDSEWCAFINDDVILPDNALELFTPQILEGYSLIGSDGVSIVSKTLSCPEDIETFTQAEISVRETNNHRNWGFGCFVLIKKERYIPIPEELKVWCGDDFIFQEYKHRGYRVGVTNLRIVTQMSTTSDRPEFDAIRNNDLAIFNRKYKRDFIV